MNTYMPQHKAKPLLHLLAVAGQMLQHNSSITLSYWLHTHSQSSKRRGVQHRKGWGAKRASEGRGTERTKQEKKPTALMLYQPSSETS